MQGGYYPPPQNQPRQQTPGGGFQPMYNQSVPQKTIVESVSELYDLIGKVAEKLTGTIKGLNERVEALEKNTMTSSNQNEVSSILKRLTESESSITQLQEKVVEAHRRAETQNENLNLKIKNLESNG